MITKKSSNNLIKILNNNEIYEKIRPLKKITKILNEDHAHGDNTSKDQEKSFELYSHENQKIIPSISSTSNEFSLKIPIQIPDTSNEALKTDDENGMTKSYFISEKDIILSDISLQQRLPIDECQYEIDLGNGWITKYQSNDKQRITSIISTDNSIQPIIPFTNTNQSNNYLQKRFSFRIITIFSIGHYRTYSFSQKSINFGRCVKHKFIRHFIHHKKCNKTLNLNTSALSESSRKIIHRSDIMLTTFNRNQDISSITKIPPAPPLPLNFNEKFSSETLKSTEFSKSIKNHLTPSGTDLSQSISIRPSQINESLLIKSKPNLRNRLRTPLTPDILALTKIHRPEHIKSSIAQRIEELKQACLISDEKSSFIIPKEKPTNLQITCEYKNNDIERKWLKEQTKLNSSIQFINTNNYLQLNNRLFLIRSIEFLDNTNYITFY